MLALVGAAACTLRQSYLVPVGVFLAVLYLPATLAVLRSRGAAGRHPGTAVAATAASLLLFLFPWALLSYRSNRTFLFPAMPGDYHSEFLLIVADRRFDDHLKSLWSNMWHGSPVVGLPFLLLAGMCIRWRQTHGALPALLWASFAGFVITVYRLPLLDATNIARYYYGFEVATVLAVTLASLSLPFDLDTGVERIRAAIPAVLVIVAIAIQVEKVGGTVSAEYRQMGDHIIATVNNPGTLPASDASYSKLQESIPAGAPVLAMLDAPFWLNFRRNRIDILDLPGAVSPGGKIPLDMMTPSSSTSPPRDIVTSPLFVRISRRRCTRGPRCCASRRRPATQS